MAQQLSDILSSLDAVYKPQAAAIQQQQATMPAYYQAQQQGLDNTKNQAFTDIGRSAEAKGMAYSGSPINEQQTYLGSTYMPAVAGLQKDQQAQDFKLSNALSDVTQRQYTQAYGIQQTQAAQDAKNAADARQASMLSSLYGHNGGDGNPQQAAQPVALTNDPNSIFGAIRSLRQAQGGSQWNWGNLKDYFNKVHGLDVGTNSPFDQAAHKYFSAGDANPTKQSPLESLQQGYYNWSNNQVQNPSKWLPL